MIKGLSEQIEEYIDNQRREIEFQVDDHIFLRISPTKGMMRFKVHGKLTLRYVGPFEILDKVREIVYPIVLPLDLLGMHNVFHVLILRKYISNPSHMVEYEPLHLHKDLT